MLVRTTDFFDLLLSRGNKDVFLESLSGLNVARYFTVSLWIPARIYITRDEVPSCADGWGDGCICIDRWIG